MATEWGSWDRRRRFMYVLSAFCMVVIAYCLLGNLDTQVAETAVTMAFLGLLGICGSYVFGATWQDVSTARAFAPRRARPPAPLSDEPPEDK